MERRQVSSPGRFDGIVTAEEVEQAAQARQAGSDRARAA